MKAKLLEIQNHLNASLIGRDNIIKSALLALVAKENSLLIGPPGTAKSLLARRISQTLQPLSENEHIYFPPLKKSLDHFPSVNSNKTDFCVTLKAICPQHKLLFWMKFLKPVHQF